MSQIDELSLIVSSDPDSGAFNRSADGSYFEIFLQNKGISIPKEAKRAFLTTEESNLWWSIPNIITGVNDKLYITGPEGVEVKSNHDLGFSQTAIISASAGTFTITDPSASLPTDGFATGDIIKVESTSQEFRILSIPSQTTALFTAVTANPATLVASTGNFERLRGGSGVTDYVVTLPQGLYDLNLMNNAVITQLENQGASSSSEPIISFNADNASQRVQIRFAFPSSKVDFSQAGTPREILGFDSLPYGPYPTAPTTVTAENTAAFNQVNYFLLHCDLTALGIPFNNEYTQVVAQIPIDRPPGSQILYRPFNPARINVNELIGASRTSIRCWLTDDKNRRVNTNGEYFSARFKIEYYS